MVQCGSVEGVLEVWKSQYVRIFPIQGPTTYQDDAMDKYEMKGRDKYEMKGGTNTRWNPGP